ncbi:hypothetical protein F220043C3_37650 [Enterocloster asparagiformis]|uniref:helix-turn-helix domain-containing protein n=1 Tax=Enterocloster asparagiformis TaxID=333367 RepID=UPI0034C13D93
MNIGATIVNLRREKGVTQEQLARAVGVSKPAVSKWETGQSCPDIQLLAPIARYFGVTIDALLSFTRTLSREEADRLAKEVPGIFEQEGFQAGMERCASLVREYPDSQYLKLKVAGLYTTCALHFREEERTEENLARFREYALELLEEILSGGESRYWVQAKGIAACCYMQNGNYDRAEAYLRELPVPEIDPDSLLPALCLYRGDWEQAADASRRVIRRYGNMALQGVGTLLRSAWELGDADTVRCASEASAALEEMLGCRTGIGWHYKLLLAMKETDEQAAGECFERYVDAVVAGICGEAEGYGRLDGGEREVGHGHADGHEQTDIQKDDPPCEGQKLLTGPGNIIDRKDRILILEQYRIAFGVEEPYRTLSGTEAYKRGMEKLRKAICGQKEGGNGA